MSATEEQPPRGGPGSLMPEQQVSADPAPPPSPSPSELADMMSKVFAPGFDASEYSNAPEFSWNEAARADWEHKDRAPSGSSIIDRNSVLDDSGRTFHGYKEGKYFLPNDAAEQDRLDLQHQGFLHLLNDKLYLAPLEDPKTVLDVATGTGIWALEFAEKHPQAQVIGTDLSEIQPTRRLPNCTFLQDDSEDEWLFGSTDNPTRFDYIHLRQVLTCFNDPRAVMRQAFKNLKPGGWVEYTDTCMDLQSVDNNTEGTAIETWCKLLAKGMALKGRDLNVMKHYAQWMREEGFVDVVEEKLLCPGNPWPENPRLKQVGQFTMTNTYGGFRGIGWKVFKALGLSGEEIDELIQNAKSDVTNSKYRIFGQVYVVYGRKPLESDK